MQGIGDGVVILLAGVAMVYGIWMLITKKMPLYFQLSIGVVACLMLGYIFDICDYIVNGLLSDGYLIGYLGSVGSFLFLLTSSVGYMDGIMDDGSPQIRKSRYIALVAPALVAVLWIPNVFSSEAMSTKIVYTILWILAMFSSYYNLKHAVIPDMGFGFVKAVRPFNVAALAFTFLQLIHLTLWSYCGWIPLLISGILFGASCIVLVVMADKGVKKWTL